VRSVLGRFLEHSRIYHFHNAGDDEYWIGSADLMNRNLDRRIETLVRVDHPEHKRRLQELISLYCDPRIKRWEMQNDGEWRRFNGDETFDLQEHLIKEYRGKK
jgi:polyphosphate kinase